MARSRIRLQQRMAQLAEVAVQGTLVEVYLRCGTASCACHRDPERRHGPHSYLKFRDPEGRATGLYLPRAHLKEARRAVAAWGELWETIVAVGHINRQALRGRVRRSRDGAKRR